MSLIDWYKTFAHDISSPFSLINPFAPVLSTTIQQTQIRPAGEQTSPGDFLLAIGVVVAGYYVIKEINKRR